MSPIRNFKNMSLLTKTCVVAVALVEEKYELLELLKSFDGEELDTLIEMSQKIVPIYKKMLADEALA